MSRLAKMRPVEWAEAILSAVESVQKELTKLAREVHELRAQLRAMSKDSERK